MTLRQAQDEALRFAGYAALFGKRDAGHDVIVPGAFARTLAERREPLPLFWQHQPDLRIGWIEAIAEDHRGLRVVATVDNRDGGAAAALRQGKTTGLSFGYRARGFTRDAAGRALTDIDLLEVSLVTHPMQHGARVHLTDEAVGQSLQWKFNQRHYEENGQFARVGEGRSYGDGSAARGSVRNGDRTIGNARTILSAPAQQAKPAKAKPAPLRMPTRKEIIASGRGRVRIEIRDNPRADASRPLYELRDFEQVNQNDRFIRSSASRHGVDPDLIRAIIYVESTHGYYDVLKRPFDANNSILPMNINTSYWGSTWGNRQSLKAPAANIEAGTRMVRSIQQAMPGASIAKIATIYNHSDAVMVNSYGARVQAVYSAKPWQRDIREIPTLK